MKKVAVILGSRSDLETMRGCVRTLEAFGVPWEAHILSAHRTAEEAGHFASQAREKGFGVVIAAAGKAAHLAGILAGHTTLPVIGVPMKTSLMGGMDSLLSTVQMPKGVPVACVAVDGADNAAILAVQILALEESTLGEKLAEYKRDLADQVLQNDAALQKEEW